MAHRTNITQDERPALSEPMNFTDGHVHRQWSESELKIVQGVLGRIDTLTRESLAEYEGRYVRELLAAGQQRLDTSTPRWICNSASQALEIAANVLRMQGRHRVGLIEPCFDNLADILRRHSLELVPIVDSGPEHGAPIPSHDYGLSAVVLVTPNNPTGTEYDSESFAEVVNACERSKTLMVWDFSFRAFSQLANQSFNAYEILEASGAEWIAIEDTGKTWPALELKASLLSSSRNLAAVIDSVHSDMILHVSPLTLALLSGLIEGSRHENFESVRSPVKKNRRLLESAIDGSDWRIVSPKGLGVAWVDIGAQQAGSIVGRLAAQGVSVLAGDKFYWSQGQDGNHPQRIRVSLVREPSSFCKAAEAFRAVSHAP